MDDLGRARRVVSSDKSTSIIDGKGSKKAVQIRLMHLTAQIEASTGESEKKELRMRRGILAGGLAIIRVRTEDEKRLAENALSAARVATETRP